MGSLPHQIRQAIINADTSIAALSRAAGVDAGSLSRFVRGKRGITLYTASRLAAALGLELVAVDHHGQQAAMEGRKRG